MRILFLAHRAPWPPDKGDRLRSHGILRWLARRHEVHLGTFADDSDPAATQAVEDHLRPLCADLMVVPRPPLARGLMAAVTGRPISFEVLSSRRLDRWIDETVERVRPDAVFGFSGQTAPNLLRLRDMTRVLDLVDVDSAKWRARWKLTRNPVHAFEAERVARFEKRCTAELDSVLVISPREAALLEDPHGRVEVVPSGIDLSQFPARERDPGGAEIVFVGAMDYAPNAEGALWFAEHVLPLVRAQVPGAGLTVLGRRPPARLAALDHVKVLGFVDDVCEHMHRATVAVVPIRTAHGVQTKALVGMAMALPTVITSDSAEGVGVVHDRDALVADEPQAFADAVARLLTDDVRRRRIAAGGHDLVRREYDWETNLARLDDILAGHGRQPCGAAGGARAGTRSKTS